MTSPVRHKSFIPYDHKDQVEVDKFIRDFDHKGDVLIARAVGSDETMETLIESDNPDYVMRRIREKYMSDSTVTIVFLGRNTWSRKFVDWEIAASLHQGPTVGKPNGVIAILSPSLSKAIIPDRLRENWQSGYAKIYPYPKSKEQLSKWIDEAFESRESEEKRKLIKNGRRKLRRNLSSGQSAGRSEISPSSNGGCNSHSDKPTNASSFSSPRSVTPRRPYLSQ